MRALAFLMCALCVPASASGIRLTYTQPVAAFYGLAAAQLPAGAPEEQVHAYLLSHLPTLQRLLADGYAVPQGELKEADLADFRERFSKAEPKVAESQRLQVERLFDRASDFVSSTSDDSPKRWARRHELLALIDAYNAHRRHYLIPAQRLQLAKYALELRSAGEGLRAVGDIQVIGAVVASDLALHGFQVAGGDRVAVSELYKRVEGLETGELILPGVAPRVQPAEPARRRYLLPLRSPKAMPEERLLREIENLKTAYGAAHKLQEGYPETVAWLAAAAYISGEPTSEIGRFYREAKEFLPQAYNQAATLAFGAAVAGVTIAALKPYYQAAMESGIQSTLVAARLAVAAAVARLPVEEVVWTYTDALQITPGLALPAATLTLAHFVTGKTLAQLREYFKDQLPERIEAQKAALLSMAFAFTEMSAWDIDVLNTAVSVILEGRPIETALFVVALVWREGLSNL